MKYINPLTYYRFVRKHWGRIKPIAIALFILASLTSFYANYHLIRSHYVIGCGVNGKTVAHFISRETCDELAQNKTDALELARRQYMEEFPDLFTN